MKACPVTQNTYNRQRVSLNGKWRYVVDPYETGYRNHRTWKPFNGHDHPLDRTYFDDRHPGSPAERIEYDFSKCPSMDIPGDWFHQVESLRYYEGSIWLHREFEYSLDNPGNRLFLRFEASNYETNVYLNGHCLGDHHGGFDPFEFEISRFLKNGINSIVVRVNNRREKDTVPAMATDWWNYGGITREVYLFEVPGCFIRDYFLQLSSGGGDFVEGFIQLDGCGDSGKVEIEIPELGWRKECTTDSAGTVRFKEEVKGLTRWSIRNPKLYGVRLRCGKEELLDRIGFRTIETRGADILLNGQPVFLRGISVHEEVPSVPRRGWNRDDCEAVFQQARDLNCNFLRLAHYPHNENMARMADEYGILLWEEIPVYWGLGYDNPAVLDSAASQLRTLVYRDRNRASVIIWSLANETPVSDSRIVFLKSLKKEIKQLDSTRLISAALDRTESEEGRVFKLDDPIARECDVMSCNQYLGWYYGSPADCRQKRWDIDCRKPFFASEFGAGALAGLHGEREQVWTEEHQAWVIEEQLLMLKKIPNWRGCSPWILFDFKSPRRNLPVIQDHWNRKGLVSPEGQRKLAFFVLQEFYASMAIRNPDP